MNLLPNLSTSTPALPESWVEKMFHKMLLDYGKKFTDQWAGADLDELIAHWARELASYTGPEIKRGLAAMETRDWPPTLPEFKKMCRAPLDLMGAYYEALAGLEARGKGEAGTWSHPAVYWAAMQHRADLMAQTHAQVKTRWEAALQAQLARTEWAEIPAPRVLLAPPDTSPNARACADVMMEKLGAEGIGKPKERDHKQWAKDIIARIARGDRTVSMIQSSFAAMAMAAK